MDRRELAKENGKIMPPAMKTVYIDCIDLWGQMLVWPVSLVAHFMAILIGFASASAQKDELHCHAEQFCNILKPLCGKRTPQKTGASRIIANQNQLLTVAWIPIDCIWIEAVARSVS